MKQFLAELTRKGEEKFLNSIQREELRETTRK
jgi:hypothetical protein